MTPLDLASAMVALLVVRAAVHVLGWLLGLPWRCAGRIAPGRRCAPLAHPHAPPGPEGARRPAGCSPAAPGQPCPGAAPAGLPSGSPGQGPAPGC